MRSGQGVLQGLFIDDLDERGRDVPELALFGEVFVSAGISALIVSAGVEGGVRLTAGLNLNDNNDWLTGGGGSERLFGDAGNNLLFGRGGADYLEGGEEDDTLDGGLDNDQLLGGDGDDTLTGGAGADSLYGGAGKDDLGGGLGFTRSPGSNSKPAGDELDLADTLVGGADNDLLQGHTGNDWLFGDEEQPVPTGARCPTDGEAGGADQLLAGEGDDFLFGGGGKDTLEGAAGADLLCGGSGNDTLVGDNGAPIRTLTLLIRAVPTRRSAAATCSMATWATTCSSGRAPMTCCMGMPATITPRATAAMTQSTAALVRMT